MKPIRPNGPFSPYDRSVSTLMNRRRFMKGAAAVTGGAAAAGMMAPTKSYAGNDISFLTWCDHTDARLIGLYEEAIGGKVNVKSYEGTGSALATIEQSQPGDWDMFMCDFQDTGMVSATGIIDQLDDSRVPWDGMFEGIQAQPHAYTNGKLYGVPDKFGYYGVAYNKDKVDPEDAKSGAIMYDPKYKGRIAVYDYYFVIMQLVGISKGIIPADITVENLESVIREPLLELKANSLLTGDILTTLNALHTESVDIIVGGAEWSVALDMANSPWLDYQYFDEGALMWNEALSIVSDSENKDAVWDCIDTTLTPDGQRYLATSDCYWAMPVMKNTPLTDDEKAILRWDEQPGILANSYPSTMGTPDVDAAMIDLWTEYLAS